MPTYPIQFFLLPTTRVPDSFRLPSNPELERAVLDRWRRKLDKRTRAVARSVAERVVGDASAGT